MRKNILSISDVEDDIEEIIDFAIQLKNDIKNGKSFNYMENKTMAMIFERPSTRTRVSFEVGMSLLGGHAIFLNKENIEMGKRESIMDVAQVLSRYVDIIMYRAINKEDLHELASYSTVPVINGLDRDEHPCQILADLMTIKEHKNKLDNLNLTFIGDGDDNLTHSYLLGCSLVGMNITVISPKKYWTKPNFIDKAKQIANKKNRNITLTEDIILVKNADVVVTDTWVSLWDENERYQRLKDFKEYQITPKIMNMAKPDALFMHCMPIYYGEEVVKEVAHGPQSVIFDEAENQLCAQMALIIKLVCSNDTK
jgi:ornithine carbamoyltransferase